MGSINTHGNGHAFISVGSNIEPRDNIGKAISLLSQQVSVVSASTFYKSAPLTRSEQPHFLNGILEIATDASPIELKFDVLRPIELKLGRVRVADKDAPRTIDLDIVLFGDCIIDEEALTLPDPDLRERPFLAIPLLELAPHITMPDTREPVSSLPSARDGHDLQTDHVLTELVKARIHR